jgi:hypothetical protein
MQANHHLSNKNIEILKFELSFCEPSLGQFVSNECSVYEYTLVNILIL